MLDARSAWGGGKEREDHPLMMITESFNESKESQQTLTSGGFSLSCFLGGQLRSLGFCFLGGQLRPLACI